MIAALGKKIIHYIIYVLMIYHTAFPQETELMPIKVVWERTFGGPKDEIGWSIQSSVDGGFIIGGSCGAPL